MGNNNAPGTTAIDAFEQRCGEDIYVAVKRQLSNLCFFSNNVKSMKDEAKKLEAVKTELETTMTNTCKTEEDLKASVKNWFVETEAVLKAVTDEIEPRLPNSDSGCWPKIKAPFSLGNEVVEKTEEMQMRRNEGSGFNRDNMFNTASAPARLPFLHSPALELKSLQLIEDDIVRVLNQGDVKIVGICGMGGAGKTTIAEKILSKMQTQGSFPAVVKVVVSQSVDLLKIQQVIMCSLDFKDEEIKEEISEVRVRLLFSKLLGQKNLLILLDDIWQELSFEELGIPREGGCTTLITSRHKDILDKMCGNNVFEIKTLPKHEAQCLFEEKAGIRLNDPTFSPTAEQIVEECGRLPLAIVTIGSALRNKGKQLWDGTLCKLKSSKRINDSVYDKLHKRLIVSYELLGDEDAELLFLLCSLFPEDHEIRIDDLALYIMGLKMLDEVDSLVEARYRVWEGVAKLKSCYLLLQGDDETQVKMHDVVRDVAILVATEKGLIDANLKSKGQHDKKCKWISVCTKSSNEPLDHLIGTNFPDLRLLLIDNDIGWRINDIFMLKGMCSLNTLSFRRVEFGSQTEEIVWPNNLITLQLMYCNHLKTLSFVGALLHLKILDCNGCWGIAELPVEIGQLKCLKLLNLSGCQDLQRIAPGIIKQLDELEELKMLRSFRRWESSKVNDEEGMNVPLNELASLHKLTCLEIEMDDISLAHEKISISSNLVKYKIGIPSYKEFSTFNCEKAICLGRLPNEMPNDGSWIRKLLATTSVEGLRLDGSGNWGNLSQTHNTLRELEITNCGMLKELVDSSTLSIGSGECGVFPMLECLKLYNLSNLNQVCDSQILEGSNFFKSLRKLELESLPFLTHFLKCGPNQQVPFNNLRKVKISKCGELLNLFWLESAKDAFTQLETLEIEECAKMKQVFISNGKISSSMTFPKLKELIMRELPSLATFWEGSESIEFPSSEELRIGELETLEIEECAKMKQVFISNGKISSSMTFPKLEYLIMSGLPSFATFCKRSESIEFPSLKELGIGKCEKLKSIVCNGMESESGQHNCGNEESALFCSHKVKLCGWEKLSILQCHNIESLFSSSIVENFAKLNYLRISNCDAMEEVFRGEKNEVMFPKLETLKLIELLNLTSVGKGIKSIEFPMLEDLMIEYCPKLKRIVTPEECDEESGEGCSNDDESFHFLFDDKVKFRGSCFRTLMSLNISVCHKIRILFSSSMVENLVNLNDLSIWDCDALEEVLRKEENKDGGKTSQVTFPKLKTLQLEGLPSLTSMCEGIENIDFPMLEDLEIEKCPKLKNIVCPAKCNDESGEGYCNKDDEAFPVFRDDKVKFNRLKSLTIEDCHVISSLFSSSSSRNFIALSNITIERCFGIKEVITREKEIHNWNTTTLFPSLKTLKIESTPLLERLCEWKCPLELSMLEQISVAGCPHLKFLTSASLTTPKLKKMCIDNKIFEEQEWKVTEDLNEFLCQHIVNVDTTEVWKKLDVHVSELSQLNVHLLPRNHLSLPLSNVVRLLYKQSGVALLVVTPNAYPMMWNWEEYNQSSASSVPKLQQLTENSLMSDDLHNDAKSTQHDSIASLAFSKGDGYLASASCGIVTLFYPDDDFKVIETFMAPPPVATYLAFNPQDSNVIAIGMDDSTIQIYNWEAGKVETMLKGGHQKRISGLAFSGSLYILVSSSVDAQLCVWRSFLGWKKNKSRPIQAPPNHPAPLDGVTRVQFRKDEYHLLVVHKSQIGIYNPQLECLRMWYPRDSLPSPVSCAMYSCDGWMIYTGFDNGAIGIFGFEDLTLLCQIVPSAYISSPILSNSNAFPRVMDIAAHPRKSNQFALGASDGAFYVIEPSNVETKSKGLISIENAMLPSIPSSSSMINELSEAQSSSIEHLNTQ